MRVCLHIKMKRMAGFTSVLHINCIHYTVSWKEDTSVVSVLLR